jgi:hypothetical protein
MFPRTSCFKSDDNMVGVQSLRPSRGLSGRVVNRVREARLDFLRLKLPFRGSKQRLDRVPSVADPPRSTFAVSGGVLREFSRLRRQPVFEAGRCSSPRVASLLEATTLLPHPPAQAGAPLLRFLSPTALIRIGRPYIPKESNPPAHSVLGVWLPPRRLAPPETLPVCFNRRRSWGSPDSPRLAGIFRSRKGRERQVSSPRLSPPLRRARFRALSSLVLRPRGSSFRSSRPWTGTPESQSQEKRRFPR